jgi:hypothetical protein
MANGIMSLAYMGEMGIVFNLAYIELEKTRYFDAIRNQIERSKKIINPIEFVHDIEKYQLMSKLQAQLDEMLDPSKMKRKLAWVRYKGEDDVQHFDFLSGTVVDWYEREIDKIWSQVMVMVSSVCVLIMTVIAGPNTFHSYDTPLTWYLLFWLLLIANLIPLLFVVLGRMLKVRAQQCTDSIQSRFTKISSSAIESALRI